MNSTVSRNNRHQIHLFTVDVEEHFQVSAFDSLISREEWSSQPSRVVDNTLRIMDLLDAASGKATFFVLGWVAEKYPQLVMRILQAGHEVASHGYSHRRVFEQTPEEFRHDVQIAKRILENAGGHAVLGYRAPSFSISPGMEWAFEILLEEGHVYDSSVFPIRRPGYGYPGAPPIPHIIPTPQGHLCEFPLMTTVYGGVRFPAAGGAYFRHLPYALTRRALIEHARSSQPGVFYIHPWEIDVNQPRIRASSFTTLRHYGGLRRTEPRLRSLLREFRFGSIASQLPDILRHAEAGDKMQMPGQ